MHKPFFGAQLLSFMFDVQVCKKLKLGGDRVEIFFQPYLSLEKHTENSLRNHVLRPRKTPYPQQLVQRGKEQSPVVIIRI